MTTNPVSIDFGRRSEDYAHHRPGFPASFFDRLQSLVRIQGASIVDLGTGPGFAAIEFIHRGANNVVGVDISPNQLEQAKKLADEQVADFQIQFQCSKAEETGLDACSIDTIFAGQCWGWFDEKKMLEEAHRILKPGGHLVVAHFDYMPRDSTVAQVTEELILKHNPQWQYADAPGSYAHRDSLTIIRNGFKLVEQFCYTHDQPFSHESWRGRVRTCNGVGSGGMTTTQVEAFDRELS